MFVKCPRCTTEYNIPDKAIGDQPRKMRCSRCKAVFAVVRRGQGAVPGYEQFGDKPFERQKEFVYLREIHTEQEQAPPVVIESQRPTGRRHDKTIVGVGQAIFKKQESTDSLEQEAAPSSAPTTEEMPTDEMPAEETPAEEMSAEESSTKELPPVPVSEAQVAPIEPKPSSKDALVEEVLRQAREKEALRAREAARLREQRASTPPAPISNPAAFPLSAPFGTTAAPSIHGRIASAWEIEAPLDLGVYAIDTTSPTAQLVGKVLSVLIALIVLFMLFVSYRNNWSISLAELDNQIAFAFSSEVRDDVLNGIAFLDVVIEEKRIVSRPGKTPLLIVEGKVYNHNPAVQSHVILRGRLFDAKQKIRVQTRFPCDKVISEAQLKRVRHGTISRLYNSGGGLRDCTISGESSTVFQMIIEDLPRNYDDTFHVDVKAISSRLLEK